MCFSNKRAVCKNFATHTKHRLIAFSRDGRKKSWIFFSPVVAENLGWQTIEPVFSLLLSFHSDLFPLLSNRLDFWKRPNNTLSKGPWFKPPCHFTEKGKLISGLGMAFLQHLLQQQRRLMATIKVKKPAAPPYCPEWESERKKMSQNVTVFLSLFFSCCRICHNFLVGFHANAAPVEKKYRKDTKYRQRIDVLDEWLKALGIRSNCLHPVLLLC